WARAGAADPINITVSPIAFKPFMAFLPFVLCDGSGRTEDSANPAPAPAHLNGVRSTAMKIFYGWVVVGAGMVATCFGLGAMLSLGVFLPPMAEATGWSRAGISTAALLNWLSMGVGSFFWGALSDRFGTRVVVLSGAILLGFGMVAGSQATTLGQFQLVFGVIVGVAAGSFYAPLGAVTTRW